MYPHRIMPVLLFGACLVPLSVSAENAAVSCDAAYFQDMEAAEQAYHRVFDRFGREPLGKLRADLLRDLPGYQSRGEFRAALQIFELTRDAEGVANVFASIPERLRNDVKLFEELGWYSSDTRALGRRAWLKALPPGYCYQWDVDDLLDDIRSKGPTSEESMQILQKLGEGNPSLFAQYLALQPNARQIVETLVRNYPSEAAAGKLRTGARMKALMGNDKTYRSEIALFYSLLDPEKGEDRGFWLECAACLGEWQAGADFLVRHLHDAYTPAEIAAAGMMCSARIDDATLRQWAKTARYQRLVSFLLQAGRAEEAQKYAEEGFGKGVDAMRAVDVWNQLGRVQQASGERTFENMLNKSEPQADTWAYFNNRFEYYKGRKEDGKAQEALQAAVDKGKAAGNGKMVSTAYMTWGAYLAESAKGIDPNAADDPRRAVYLKAMDCYEKAYDAACGTDDVHQRAWCADRIIAQCEGRYDSDMYRGIVGAEKAEARLKRLYKTELAAGYPLGKGIPYAAERTPIRIDDPVFAAITDPKRCKYIYGGLSEGLLIQLAHARQDEVQPLLKKMADLLEKEDAKDGRDKTSGKGDTFCQAIIFASRDMPWKAVAAKYALQRYPDYVSSNFPAASVRLLETALPALDPAEARTIADRMWEKKRMDPEQRMKLLQNMMEKAEPASPEYEALRKERDALFGGPEASGKGG